VCIVGIVNLSRMRFPGESLKRVQPTESFCILASGEITML
jgi:hypothetical protein